MRAAWWALALLACSTPRSGTEPSPPAAVKRTLPPPTHIPARVRALISDRMQRHGDDMSVLLWATLFLDYGSTAEIADAIATEPRFSRPLYGEVEALNSPLPPRFFDYQDEVVERAQALARLSVSEPRDADAIAAAFGRLAETCVGCHAAYLNDPGGGP